MDLSKHYSNFKSNYSKDFKSFIRSIVALLMAVMLVLGSTFAWIEGSKKAKANGNECTVSAGAGLQFLGTGVKNGVLTLDNSTTLEDCSSVDGRNFFIPTSGSIRSADANPDESNLSNLVFRSGLDVDSNSKYITKDFIVSSMESSSTPGKTPIYIGSGSSFTCSDAARAKAFRISINFNDGTKPILICPGLTYATESRSHNAVQTISAEGKATAASGITADPMSKYYYGQTPVYELPNGESRRVTVTIWLEGTDTDCTSDLAGDTINMNLILSTEDSHMRTVTFVDYSPSSWVKKDDATMYVVERTSKASYAMTRTGNITYTASIPEGFTDIYFQRTTDNKLDPNAQDAHNSWSTDEMDDNLSASTTYYAIGRGPGTDANNPIDDKNYGYWVNQNAPKMLDIYFTDVTDSYKIDSKVVNGVTTRNGHSPFIHYFNSTTYGKYGTDNQLKPWNGFEMEYVGQNEKNQPVYHILVPADSNAKILFNNKCQAHNDHPSYIEIESVQINLSDYITGSDPQIKKIGFYTNVNNNTTQLSWWDPTNFKP